MAETEFNLTRKYYLLSAHVKDVFRYLREADHSAKQAIILPIEDVHAFLLELRACSLREVTNSVRDTHGVQSSEYLKPAIAVLGYILCLPEQIVVFCPDWHSRVCLVSSSCTWASNTQGAAASLFMGYDALSILYHRQAACSVRFTDDDIAVNDTVPPLDKRRPK